jgi:hypothetical protein
MSCHHDRASARPLPLGLRICETCGEPRGTSRGGGVSACFCSRLNCNRCGARRRRPITDDCGWRAVVHVSGRARIPVFFVGDGDQTIHDWRLTDLRGR